MVESPNLSELILQRELHDPRIAGGPDLRAQDAAEVHVVDRRRRIAPAEPVEGVERLDARLDAMRVEWGRPTLVLRDPDGNELFFWIPDSEWANLPPDLPALYP